MTTRDRQTDRQSVCLRKRTRSITYYGNYEVLVGPDRALVNVASSPRHAAHSRPGAAREGEALCRDDLARISGDLARISADLAPISGRRQPSSAAQPRASVP